MAEQRLPVVDADDGQWGAVLNQFIEKEHYNTGIDNVLNGSHKNITIRPGTTNPGTAPIKFSSGALMSSPEPGSMEFLTDKLYFTQTTGAIRKTIATYNDSSGSTGDLYYRDSSGNFVRLPIGENTGSVLNVNGGLPSWGPVVSASSSGSTIVQRDASGNIFSNGIIEGYETTTTAARTTNLSSLSASQQFFVGSLAQTVVMPDVTNSIALGQSWQIVNNSTNALTLNPYGSANLIVALSPGLRATLTCSSILFNDVSSWSLTVDISRLFTVGTADPSTYGTPSVGDIWIDTN